jgi:ABC-type dipeptide/oligopeptide/nickel transport system ATPase subunit
VPSRVQIVFQQPLEALNPFHSVGRSIGEPMKGLRRAERRAQVRDLLDAVGIASSRLDDRPARFSGGQLQRIVIARALAARPKVLLCDEPTSSLDVSVQAQIINLLVELQKQLNFAAILVTHDLAVAKVLSDEVLVLRSGTVVEHATADAFFESPAADYSRHLLSLTFEPVGSGRGLSAGPS